MPIECSVASQASTLNRIPCYVSELRGRTQRQAGKTDNRQRVDNTDVSCCFRSLLNSQFLSPSICNKLSRRRQIANQTPIGHPPSRPSIVFDRLCVRSRLISRLRARARARVRTKGLRSTESLSLPGKIGAIQRATDNSALSSRSDYSPLLSRSCQ